MSKILCIVAGQRSGTTALQSALGATGKFENFGEIFQNGPHRHKGAFIDFAANADIRFEDFSTHAKCSEVAERYISHLRELAQGKFPLIDVKYNSWNVIKPLWSYPTEQPFFMKSLRTDRCAFVMILREGLWDQIMSEEIARKSSVWHNLTVENTESIQVKLNLNMVRQKAKLILQTETMLFDYLKPVKKAVFLKYEDLYTSGGYSNKFIQFVNGQFKLSLAQSISGGIRKNQVDKRDVIQNYNAVVRVVKEQIHAAGGRAF